MYYKTKSKTKTKIHWLEEIALPRSVLSFEEHTHKQHLTILQIESCISYLDDAKAKSMMQILHHPSDQTQVRIDVCQNEALKTNSIEYLKCVAHAEGHFL